MLTFHSGKKSIFASKMVFTKPLKEGAYSVHFVLIMQSHVLALIRMNYLWTFPLILT